MISIGVLHLQMSSAAVNQIPVINEAMNGYKNLRIKRLLPNVNLNDIIMVEFAR